MHHDYGMRITVDIDEAVLAEVEKITGGVKIPGM